MLSITGSEIKLTRGDTAYLSVGIKNKDGSTYEIRPDDTLSFSVKKFTKSQEYAFRKDVLGISEFKILPEDTADLAFGTYKYDVQLTKSNGDIFTVIPASSFTLMDEVTV